DYALRPIRPTKSLHLHLDGADPGKLETIAPRFLWKYGLHHAAGHHDLACLQARASRVELRGKPGGGVQGMPADVAAITLAKRGTILAGAPERFLKIAPFGQKFRQHNAGVPGIVGDKRTNVEIAVIGGPIVDEFDCGANAVDMGRDRFGGPRLALD